MSNRSTYAPSTVEAENAVIAERVASLLQEEDIPFVRDGLYFRVAPAYDGDIAKAFIDARASEEERAAEQRREVEASISLEGLSVDEARRLIRSVKSGTAPRSLPDDLQRSLGLADPDQEAVVRIVFTRRSTPSTREVENWLRAAVVTYFNQHEKFCGISDDDAEAQQVIKSVRVENVMRKRDDA